MKLEKMASFTVTPFFKKLNKEIMVSPVLIAKSFFKELFKASLEEISNKDINILKVERQKEMESRLRIIESISLDMETINIQIRNNITILKSLDPKSEKAFLLNEKNDQLFNDLKGFYQQLNEVKNKSFKTNEQLLKANESVIKERRKTWGDRGFRTLGSFIGIIIGGALGGVLGGTLGSVIPGGGTLVGVAIGVAIAVPITLMVGYVIQQSALKKGIPITKAFKRAIHAAKKERQQLKGKQTQRHESYFTLEVLLNDMNLMQAQYPEVKISPPEFQAREKSSKQRKNYSVY